MREELFGIIRDNTMLYVFVQAFTHMHMFAYSHHILFLSLSIFLSLSATMNAFCPLTLLLAIRSYPKHVWSPAGGWYTQPANWKSNTAICIVIMFGIMTLVWDYGSKREVRVSHVEVDRKKWREEQQQKKKMKMKKTEQDH